MIRRLLAALLLLTLSTAGFAAQTRDTFDHLTTGFELLGEHRDLPCEACHANAIFKGTPHDCGACHGIGTAVRATAKPANHILSTDRCDSCHTANAWAPAVNFDHAEARGSCSTCHNGVQAQGKGPTHIQTDLECDVCHSTISWDAGLAKPTNHIPTSAPCTQCHTTAGNYALYSVAGVHQGVTECASCHAPGVANTFGNVTIVTTSANHIPIGNVDCGSSGCHTTGNVNPGGFYLGAANLANPTLNIAGHTSVAAGVSACTTCHEAASYQGMIAGSASAAGDSRPTAFDKSHPTSGDCSGCHTTTPTFTTNVGNSAKPANHIPTSAPCTQCHTTAGNYALYSVTGTHQGVTSCLSCHGSTVANTFANIKITTTSANHIPVGNVDCGSSGCHTTGNVNPGGFNIGSANIANPTLNIAGHASVAAAEPSCTTCHETAPYQGMIASSASAAGDSRPTAFDKNHPTSGDCTGCHTTTPTFATDLSTSAKPANHIPTTAVCSQCHTTAGNYALYSVTGTHQGVTSCLACHGPSVATTFANVTIVTTPGNHIPIGSLDCNGGGCHTATNVNPGGFSLGSANISSPTLNTTGHTTVAAAVAACQTCHEAAAYLGMTASTSSAPGDSRPSTALDAAHPTTGDCGSCHLTSPTFKTNVVTGTKPANHIPTTAACTQCHTTAGNFALYSVTGTHQGVTGCLVCHAPAVANTFANITITTTTASHIPIGTLDCNGSGCHTTSNVNSGGFHIGAANISSPTLNVAGHTTVAAAVATCSTCHETAPYQGMVASSASAAGDSRPTALDKNHPTSGDCSGCHTTTPTFGNNETGGSTKPANHIPTSAPCAQCHTTAGNYAAYSVTGTHQGVTGCLTCHGPSVAGTFANITIVTTPGSHIPIGTLDCNGSGCHTTANVNSGGFHLGAANISSPTLTTTGHTTVATAVTTCQTCHETAPYLGMIASSSTAAGDSRPTAFDKSHPTSGDCNGCHTTTPTFGSNVTGGSKPANHIPTNAPCAQCHTTAGNYALYVMGAQGHTGITSNCAQCHADGLSFANMAPPTLVEPPTGATGHIPVGTLACELCHSTTNFTTFSGTVMKHAVVRANACDSCHEYGMKWKTNAGAQLWTRPSPNHHAGQDCGGSGCHTSRDKRQVRPPASAPAKTTNATAATAVATPQVVARGNVRGALATGTGGAASLVALPGAADKPADHIPTTNACLSCHNTLAWLPVRVVDHTQVIGSCTSCHNGRLARSKPPRHMVSSNACDSCHTTNAWTPARIDHNAFPASACSTCHNGVQAIGLPHNHVPTSLQCGTCHGTLAWLPAKLDHAGLAVCQTCHNNTIAVGKPASHVVTTRDCVTCHTYPDWSVITSHQSQLDSRNRAPNAVPKH